METVSKLLCNSSFLLKVICIILYIFLGSTYSIYHGVMLNSCNSPGPGFVVCIPNTHSSSINQNKKMLQVEF